DNQAGHHAIVFFTVAMWLEETAAAVHQQFVELGTEFAGGESQFIGDLGNHCGNLCIPFVTDLKSIRGQFEGLADFRVHQRLCPLAKWRLLALRHQGVNHLWFERKIQWSCLINTDRGRHP
ncbi:MAG: hypothetical protein ACK48U_16395, partial [Planctomyces sp.]